MRIERLEIEGFGPFAERQVIDFAPLDEAGLFLITGRTGSGKSSILDAVCFALYGTAPRYDGAQARLRSDHAAIGTPTRVELVFAVGTDRWRVVRSPEYERPKQRGTGTTREPQAATLERWDDAGGWVGVAARPVDVAEHLGPVLQLTREQFLQVILLAQGRFQEFLKARSEDRLGLLRALFGTERFQRFESEITDRARSLEQAVDGRVAAVRGDVHRLAALVDEPDPEDAEAAWAAGIAERLAARVADGEQEAERARAAFVAADGAAAAAVATAGLQRRRTAARAALERLEADRPAVEAARERVAQAVRVLPVLPAVQSAERAAAGLLVAARTVEAARAEVGAEVPDPAAAVAELDGLIGALDDAAREERALPRLERDVVDASAARAAAEGRVAALVVESEAVPVARAGLQEELTGAAAVAAALGAAEEALTRARRVAEAVVGTQRAAAAVLEAERRFEGALGEEQAATGRTRGLLAARIAGAAGILAAGLEPGAPCPVCGSAEHPAPAPGDTETPDDAAVEAAEDEQRRCAERRAAAGADAAAARSAHAAAAALSGGISPEAAAAAVGTAEAEVVATQQAALRRDRATAALAELDRRAADLDRELAAARAVVDERIAALATATSLRDGARTRVAGARLEAPTVAERVAGLRARRDALRDLDLALRAHADAAATDRDARERLTAALAEAGLPDAEAARTRAMPTADREQQEERVRAWETARDGAAAQLADPEVAGAADEPADVVGTAAAKALALQERDAAADRLAVARSRAVTAQELAGAISAAATELAEDRARLEVVGPLAEVVRGTGGNELRMRLESYVLAARLEQIVAAANVRLTAMTDGRFTLHHDDGVAYRGARSGLGLEVLDEHTGRPRPVASLSGGETFLASLSLALGLAEVVSAEAGGVRLDTLFVDEGFGTLDRRTLDTAMETLDSLRAGGRTVGLISHVEAMLEDIPAGLQVERLPDGSSAVRSRLPAPVPA